MSKVKNKNKFSAEVADDQLELLCDFYGVDLDDNESGTKQIAQQRLLQGIRQGRLTITDKDGLTVIQTLKNPPSEIKEINYRIITGGDRARMEKLAGDIIYERMYVLCGFASGLGDKALKRLYGPDIAVVEGLAVVFLGL